MADPHDITPDALEILIARDLRKAGLDVERIRRRALERADQDSRDYRLELVAELRTPEPRRLRIECHRRADPLGADPVRGFAGARSDARAGVGTRPASAGMMMVCTAGFTPEALTTAAEAGITLLRVADARAAFDASGWGPRGQYPMWLPEYVLELATRDAAGLPTYEMLGAEAGARLITRVRADGAPPQPG